MRTLAVFVVLLFITACQAPPTEITEAEKAEVVAEVEAYFAEFAEIWAALDLERSHSLNVQGPEFTWATGGAITRGYEANSENAKAIYSSVGSVDWEPTDRHIAVLSRDAAAVLMVGRMAVTNAGEVTWEATYTYSYILVRRDGEWKTLLGHGSFEEG